MTKYGTNPCLETPLTKNISTFLRKDMKRVLIEQQVNARKVELDMQNKWHAEAAMDRFFAGIPYEEMLELAKERYPEKFI